MKKLAANIQVKTEREFVLAMVKTGIFILILACSMSISVIWVTTRDLAPDVRYRAILTAAVLPFFIVPVCMTTIGYQNLREHRRMLEITRIALTDEMTGLANRRSFMREGQARLEAAKTPGQAGICLLIVDLDHFKAVNDKYGHGAGDETLIHVAECMETAMPRKALIARLGGEEFAIMVSFEDMDDIHRHAEALRQSVAGSPCQVGEEQIAVTISVGVGIASDEDTLNSLMSRADCALYAAKSDGRNRFSIAA